VDWCVPNPRIVASITEDWFYLVEFTSEVAVNYSVYESEGGTLVFQGTATTDGSGFVWVDAEERWDLEPGNYLMVSDGNTTRELVIEGFTFDVFDLANGHLEGTAPSPFGRTVWVGVGFENDSWSMEVSTDLNGNWAADFDTPVPSNYQWVAAQIFDEDGDASELRPDQVVNLWVSAYTYDLPAGTLTDGTYPYHFELEWSFPEAGTFSGQGGELVISSGVPTYDGYVLLRGLRELRGINSPEGLSCEEVSEINPNQPMRFLIGWLPEYGMTNSDVLTYFDNLAGSVVWGDDMSAELTPHEIIPFSFDDLDDWYQYVCTYTSGPPTMGLRVNYGHDWVESFYEAGHEVVVTVTESDGVTVKATATVFTEPKDFWGWETRLQTAPDDWDSEPPDLQANDWVYAQVDNGVIAHVQLGNIVGEVDSTTDSITGAIEASWLADRFRLSAWIGVPEEGRSIKTLASCPPMAPAPIPAPGILSMSGMCNPGRILGWVTLPLMGTG